MRRAVPSLLTALLLLAHGEPARADPPPTLPPIEEIVVHKAARVMELYAGGHPVWTIAHLQLGRQPIGPKRFRGDHRTPEGRYVIDYGNEASAYHLALHISYPSPDDTAQARAAGRSPGGEVFIHGQPDDWPGLAAHGGRAPGDWTDGCIAVSDAEMDLLWQVVGDGTPITILP